MAGAPSYRSWLDQVGRIFALITAKGIRRGSFTGVKQLAQRIDHFVVSHNQKSEPFCWIALIKAGMLSASDDRPQPSTPDRAPSCAREHQPRFGVLRNESANDADLKLMRHSDELHLELPFAGVSACYAFCCVPKASLWVAST